MRPNFKPMKTAQKVTLAIGLMAVLATAAVYALFYGYFDRGHYEVLHTEISPTGKVAIVAQRSDDQALGGLEYFLVIGDHIYSPRELRHALYSRGVVFSAGMNCFTASWDSATQLTVDCHNDTIPAGEINIELHQFQGTTILYKNISPQTAK
jgi:hypothetical protein